MIINKIVEVISKLEIKNNIVPISSGTGGGVFGAFVFGEMIQTAISAVIFALIGTVVGFYVTKFLKKTEKGK